MPMFGPWELVILLLIVVVIFGAGRLSQIGGALGKSVREFRSATQDEAPTTSVTPVSAPAAAAVTRTCPSCGQLNSETQNFCSECGAALAAPAATASLVTAEPVTSVTCPSCATSNPAGQAFCGQCGTGLSTRAA